MTPDQPDPKLPDRSGLMELVEAFLLGEAPHLTRVQVAEQAGVPLEVATQLWRQLGFPELSDDQVAFTSADVEALRLSHDLIQLGILSPDRQAALVRTWGRSFARLAEWQIELITQVALEAGAESAEAFTGLADEVVPRVESLQSYVWRRHLASAGSRVLAEETTGSSTADLGVVFVDIVGYTARSKTMTEPELVAWLEDFESQVLEIAVDRGARIIKNIGDELLLVADDATTGVDIALELTARGEDDDDPFPRVRAGVAFGEVVSRLGDVYGPTVNVASRLTSVARPGTVLVDGGVYTSVTGDVAPEKGAEEDPSDAREADRGTPYRLRRLRRLSVKGYPRLAAWRAHARK